MRTIPTVRNLLLLPLMATCAAGQTKPIPIGVKVEAEGGGEGQGMWDRPAQDLAPKELKALESLVVGEIGKQPGVKIVPLDSSSDYIAVVVVAAKLRNGNTEENWYIASSVVTIATTKGIDELVTHDVVAAADLTSVARSIGFQFASARLRTATGFGSEPVACQVSLCLPWLTMVPGLASAPQRQLRRPEIPMARCARMG